MKALITVYKAGECPRVIHSVDLSDYLTNGWSTEDSQNPIPANSTIVERDEDSVVTKNASRDDREAKLKAILAEEAGWKSIKEIANSLGITKKPQGGWDEAIPMILTEEFKDDQQSIS